MINLMLKQVWTTHFLFYGNKQIIHTTSKQPEEWDTKYESYLFTFGALLQLFILKGDSTFSRGVTLTFLWSYRLILTACFKNIQYILL